MVKQVIKNVLILLPLVISCSVNASPSLDSDRTAVIEGPITSGSLSDVETAVYNWSHKDPKKPIDLIINSPGGSVVAGFWFINKMEAARAGGTKFRCYVPEVAASMAFQILLHCDERYSLDRAFLLWHRVRIMGGDEPLTSPQLSYLAWHLSKLDDIILGELFKALNKEVGEGTIRYHFEHETLHTAMDLAALAPKSFKSYPDIPKLYELLYNNKVPRSIHVFSLFGMFQPGTIYYMSEDLAHQMGWDK